MKKSCVVFVLAVISTTVSSLGSGPYLPSGWRPKGAAFLLPTEVQKTEVVPESNEENEAVGTEELREYGPPAPQDIYQSITKQALPDLYTERAFAAENGDSSEKHDDSEIETRSEAVYNIETGEIGSTETVKADIVEENDDTEVIRGATTPAESEEDTIGASLENTDTERSTADITTPTEVFATIYTTEQNAAVNSILSDELVITKVGSEISTDVTEEADAVKESDVTPKGPDGDVLTPVGFREYGPPKFSRDEDKSGHKLLDANEIRKRRFLTKFLRNH